MNRLFIIGNGFDLAHGLPTSYGAFIDDFWKNIKQNSQSEEYKKFVTINEFNASFLDRIDPLNNFEDFKSGLEKISEDYGSNFSKKDVSSIMISSKKYLFRFKNDFFKDLNKIQSIEKWVDIENEYYKKLKKIVKEQKFNSHEKKKSVEKLNNEFNQIKTLLEHYLLKKVLSIYNIRPHSVNSKFNSLLQPISRFNLNSLEEKELLKEYSNKKDQDEISKTLENQRDTNEINTRTFNLNFNYTPTIDNYLSGNPYCISNYIHGKIGDLDNPIIFGFGDEMDEDYKLIENIDDNEYLKFFKSFQYLQTQIIIIY